MAISRVEASYQTEPPTPITELKHGGSGVYPTLEAAIGHTFSASVLLLTQSTSLEAVPEHDMIRDASVDAIRDLARRLCHIKSLSEAFQIGIEIERHCNGYYEADAPADAAVATATVCNIEARTEVRQATGQIDGAMCRQRGTSRRGGSGGRRNG